MIDYFDEVDRFYAWSMANAPSASAIVLWHALMHTWRSIGCPETFTIAIKALSVKTGLEKAAILRARNTLKQLGRIDWAERKGNLSSRYTIFVFGKNWEANGGAVRESVGESVARAKQDSVGLTIINKDLYDNNINDVDVVYNRLENNGDFDPLSLVRGYYERQIGNCLSVRAEKSVKDYIDSGVEPQLLLRAIDASIDAGANNWLYANKIIVNCVKKGVFTLSDYERAEADRRERLAKSVDGNGKSKNKFKNFTERGDGDGLTFQEVMRLEREKIDRELGE